MESLIRISQYNIDDKILVSVSFDAENINFFISHSLTDSLVEDKSVQGEIDMRKDEYFS